MFRQGLSIDVLEEELPGTSYILSYNGNQPALMAMELAYMLEQGLQVTNLYIDLYPYTAAAAPGSVTRRFFLIRIWISRSGPGG